MSALGTDEPLDLVIVGAGFSGLAMAIRARAAGLHRFTILEKAERVGGTWRENTYPGAACDVTVSLYSLSFDPGRDWSRLYPRQPEILAYLERLVADHALAPHLRLGTAVRAAVWSEAERCWRIETGAETIRTRCLVLAVGGLHHPARPDLPGLDRFAGPVFHTARWDHACPLAGRRVGVVGTGASAIQVVPALAGQVGRLSVFQRSPPWVLPRGDRALGAAERGRLSRWPLLRRLRRAAAFWQHEIYALAGFTRVSRLTRLGEAAARRHLRRSIPDAGLRATLTPRYRLGCKRVLFSDTYYPALTRDDVDLVADPIRSVEPDGVTTTDGRKHPLDVLVLATGFDLSGSFARIAIQGREGRSLREAWQDGAETFQGMAVRGFPNLFMLLGPNTGLGHNSVLLMVEAQVAHVVEALGHLARRPEAVLDVRDAAQARFMAEIDARMRGSIWTEGGCASWYLDGKGRNRTLWPGTVLAYQRAVRRLRLGDYYEVERG